MTERTRSHEPQGEERRDARRLVLASGSPRRREMLAAQGLDFEVRVADIDETPRGREAANDYVRRLAEDKAAAVASALGETAEAHLIIAADTIVERDGELLGKPRSRDDARRMVSALSDRAHRVCTGVAVRSSGRSASGIETSTVRFGPMSEAEIAWYVDTGEPMDKAGAYAIQGFAAPFIEGIDGCYHNIVGLPLSRLRELLRDIDVDWRALPRTRG